MHRCNRLACVCVRACVSREAIHDEMIAAVFFSPTNLLITIHKFNSLSSSLAPQSVKVRLIELALNQTSTDPSLTTLLINKLGSLEFFIRTHIESSGQPLTARWYKRENGE